MISVGLGSGGDHGCLGADARPARFFNGSFRSLDSPVLILAGASAIFAPACWEESVGDTGEPRLEWAGMPRADARLLAIDEDSRPGNRGRAPGSLGG